MSLLITDVALLSHQVICNSKVEKNVENLWKIGRFSSTSYILFNFFLQQLSQFIK